MHDDDEDDDGGHHSPPASASGAGMTPFSARRDRFNSVGYLDDEALRRKEESDRRVAGYVADQLRRINSGNGGAGVEVEVEDELEAE